MNLEEVEPGRLVTYYSGYDNRTSSAIIEELEILGPIEGERWNRYVPMKVIETPYDRNLNTIRNVSTNYLSGHWFHLKEEMKVDE